jgi:hypothetical protein
MRYFVFSILALVIAIATQCGLGWLPASSALGGYIFASTVLLPMLATAGLGYAMRISNLLYVFFVAILSPFVSGFLIFVVVVHVLHQNPYFW